MEIVEIYPDCLYAVKFEDQDQNEFEKAFSLWQDLDYLIQYFENNSELLKSDFWKSIPISEDYEDLAQIIVDESFELLDLISDIADNTNNGNIPDFDSYFKDLGGKYKFLREYIPQKAKGTNNPTMLRLYAIRIDRNCYLVVHGGIKLSKKIQETPALNNALFPKLDNVIQYLKDNCVIDTEDLK